MKLKFLLLSGLLASTLCAAQAPPARAIQGPAPDTKTEKTQAPGDGNLSCDALKKRVATLEKLVAAQKEKIALLESSMNKGGPK